MMDRKKLLLLYNPSAGRAQTSRNLDMLLQKFCTGGCETTVYPILDGLNAEDILAGAESAGYDIVVCCGGDGTLHHTVNGLLRLEQPPLLGYIPSGSTNDFAASLGLPKSMQEAAADIVEGSPYPIDIGRFCKDQYFVYIAGFGAFTEVSYLTPQDKKNWLGHNAYVLEGVKSLAGLKPRHMRVEWDDQVLEEDFVFGMVTNTISVGGFKGLVNQSVALNDGEFEVLLIRMPRTPVDLTNIINYMFLKEEPNEYVYKFKTRAIRMVSDAPVDWVLDGEFGGSRTEVEIVNLQKKIRILRRNDELM